MCGLAGFLDGVHRLDQADGLRIARGMGATLRHRGPDDCGVWWDGSAGLALAHQRLSIVDLSATGHQPMPSPSGRFMIVYNGEIYNYRDLQLELTNLGVVFRGSSDTEVLLAAIDCWGIEDTLDRIAGMYAFALWDRWDRTLHLVRDRLGKKPLYFGWAGRTFLFASELKAFHAHPDFVPELNRDAVAMYLRYACVPGPHSIYQGVFKLPPAGHLALPGDLKQAQVSLLDRVRIYWSLRDVAQRGVQQPLQLHERDAVDELERVLSEAVAQRMIADVPVGAFLSGGIDSSTVVALMQKCSSRPVSTFTIGFREAGYNEAECAKQVAQHLGTDHHELYLTPGDAQDVLPRLSEIYDEPFADISQIPTLLVSRFTRGHVKVALSGDGGDESFAGYNRHVIGPRLWGVVGYCPGAIRRSCAGLLTSISPDRWDHGFERVNPWLPGWARRPTPGEHLHKLADLLATDRSEDLFERLVSHWTDPSSLVIGAHETQVSGDYGLDLDLGGLTHCMMYHDSSRYLPDDILVKVDRASMAVSLEVRAPLLDPRVVALAWRLPRSMKIRGGRGKWILRELLARHVPLKLVDRPKQGFTVPVDRWLREPLRDWAEDMLGAERLRREGVFEPEPIRRAWEEHSAGKRNRGRQLWCVLMFQAWLEQWGSLRGSSSGALQSLAPSDPSELPSLAI